eukprot:gnl/TRDRNA2_/TRDRNA2_38503_c0_seq1.p1 gnl/TRDRNA2_/TRDRNA2_38503_c0~~gnl/TRDRNA2_/TRDRNA2_38503_c0_seq1.p1  ORF type:complete len:229 (-),score=51.56 gnl/TRDRNA2_/TRDRNA2_38503_c0_seq1:170-856(-)
MVVATKLLKCDLGPMPVDVLSSGMFDGLRDMRERSELCDVVLTSGGRSFPAHRAVLAAVSPALRELCLAQPGPEALVLRLEEVAGPEAVQMMITHIYGPGDQEYSPGTDQINRDVLRLAQRFQLQQLQEKASRWLAQSLTTANVVQRLVTTDEFNLVEVRDRILEQLIANPEALYVLLSNDPTMTKVPMVLRDLLLQVLTLLGCDSKVQSKPGKLQFDTNGTAKAGLS